MKDNFRAYIEHFSTEPPPARHHQLLIDKLQDVADGKIKRLMVFMPPGSAKSFYANVQFSSWWMARNPGKKLITASYSQEVADKWGRRVRGIVKDEQFEQAFNVALSAESQAAGRWALNDDTEYYAVGVGGSVTSFRADGAIIDDPVKGREEAESETMRAKIKEWYLSDFWTRLKPESFVVLIMTRWHEDDLAGWLLERAKNGGEQWDVLCLPMEADSADDPMGRQIGEPLWPQWFTPHMLTQAKLDARNWASLYQQRPSPETGAFFESRWFKYYETLPDNLRLYGASDYAVTDGGGDYTVHGIFGLDTADNLYVVDWWRGQKATLDWVEQLILMIKAHRPVMWFEEAGVIFKSMNPIITKRQQEASAYCTRKQITRTRSKEMSAQAIRGRMQQGKVYLPAAAEWMASLRAEMLTFPSGKHDDQVDVMALIGMALGDMSNDVTQYKSIMM
jgi:predicted phage terminase large subunit-like protein